MAELTKEFVVKTAVQWKAFSHPLRRSILNLLMGQELTNEELARALGVASGKLYFHTRTLLMAGLIEVARTRQSGAITEKLYRASAQRYVAEPVSGGDSPPLLNAILSGMSLYQDSWRQDEAILSLGYHLTATVSPRHTRAFVERIQDLAAEFSDAGSNETDAGGVALTVLLHTLPSRTEKEMK